MKKIALAGLFALAFLAAPSAAFAEDIDWTFGKRLDTAEKKIKVLEDKVAALEGAQKVQGAKPANPPLVKAGEACPVGGCLQPGECGRAGCTASCATGCPTGKVGAATSVTYAESSSTVTTVSSGRVVGSGFLRGVFARLRGKIRGGGCCNSSSGGGQSVNPQPDEAPIYYNQRPVTYAPATTYYGTSGSSGIPAGWSCGPTGCFKTK